MKANIGMIDKAIRITFAIGLIGAGLLFDNWWGVIGAMPIAVALIMTALVEYCPAYSALGVCTRPSMGSVEQQ